MTSEKLGESKVADGKSPRESGTVVLVPGGGCAPSFEERYGTIWANRIVVHPWQPAALWGTQKIRDATMCKEDL
jgi:hypothetical protein